MSNPGEHTVKNAQGLADLPGMVQYRYDILHSSSASTTRECQVELLRSDVRQQAATDGETLNPVDESVSRRTCGHQEAFAMPTRLNQGSVGFKV